jgi:hypothetical protein
MAITQAKVLAVVNIALRDGPPTEMEKLSLLEFKEELLQAFRLENEEARRQQITEKTQEPVDFEEKRLPQGEPVQEQEEEEQEPSPEEGKAEGESKPVAAIHKHGFSSPEAQAKREERRKSRN